MDESEAVARYRDSLGLGVPEDVSEAVGELVFQGVDWSPVWETYARVVALGPPPERIMITGELLDVADGRYLGRRGSVVRIAVENLDAVYRLTHYDPRSNLYAARLAKVFRYEGVDSSEPVAVG